MATQSPKPAREGQEKLTWKELKQLIEAAGVQDDDEIDSVDISWGDADQFEARKDDDFGWQIRL